MPASAPHDNPDPVISRTDVAGRRHRHDFHLESAAQERATRRVLVLTATAMVVEIAAGYYFGSMALLADGWHMGTHATAFGVTLFAYAFARRRAADPRYSFGTGKVGVLAGFASAVALLGVALMMAMESGHRLVEPQTVRYDAALVVAAAGLAVNLVSALLLGGARADHGGHDHNLQSAYLHVLTDALTSVLAIVALLFGKYLGWTAMDPLMGLAGAVLIGRWSVQLIRDSAAILLDGSADEGTRARIRGLIEAEPGTLITDLHVWKVGPRDYAAIISLSAAEPGSPDHYKRRLSTLDELSHVSVEVNPARAAVRSPAGRVPRLPDRGR